MTPVLGNGQTFESLSAITLGALYGNFLDVDLEAADAFKLPGIAAKPLTGGLACGAVPYPERSTP